MPHSECIRVRGWDAPLWAFSIGGRSSKEQALRLYIFRRDEFICQHCGRKMEDEYDEGRRMHIDHLLPKKYGGPHVAWNLALSCQRCNCSRQHWRLPIDVLVSTIRLELEINGSPA